MILRDPNRASELARLHAMVEARLRRQAAGLAWDFTHVCRVARNADRLAQACAGETTDDIDGDVLEAAALLHEAGRLPHALRQPLAEASAKVAEEMLRSAGLAELVWDVCATIVAHQTPERRPTTWEARILRDADLLEDLGAVGVARALLMAADAAIPALYDQADPRAEGREPDPHAYVLDELHALVERASSAPCTEPGRHEAARRARVLTAYREALLKEAGLA